MKVQQIAAKAIVVLMLASPGSQVLAGKRLTTDIHFRPTLLTDSAAAGSSVSAAPEESAASNGFTPATNDAAQNPDPRLSQAINELEVQGDLYSLSLREPLLARANAMLHSGNPQAALADLDRAMQITRIQEGLNSVGQVAILRMMINTHVQLDDYPNAHRLQEALLNLQIQSYGKDSVALVPALLEWADWNVNMYMGGQLLGSDVAPVNPAQGSSPLGNPNPFMQEAHARYVSALEILHQQSNAYDSNLLLIERKLAAVNFMVDREMLQKLERVQKNVGDEFDINNDRLANRVRNFHFINGDTALKRALAYGYLGTEPDHDYIAARMLELADWNLLFDHRKTALDLYQKTQELLAATNLPQQAIDSFFEGGLPVETPDSAYQQALEPEAFTDYIDVEFKLSKYGAASDTRLLTDSDADPVVVDELLRTIRNAKFRPVFAQGSPRNEETVKLRYFYAVR